MPHLLSLMDNKNKFPSKFVISFTFCKKYKIGKYVLKQSIQLFLPIQAFDIVIYIQFLAFMVSLIFYPTWGIFHRFSKVDPSISWQAVLHCKLFVQFSTQGCTEKKYSRHYVCTDLEKHFYGLHSLTSSHYKKPPSCKVDNEIMHGLWGYN